VDLRGAGRRIRDIVPDAIEAAYDYIAPQADAACNRGHSPDALRYRATNRLTQLLALTGRKRQTPRAATSLPVKRRISSLGGSRGRRCPLSIHSADEVAGDRLEVADLLDLALLFTSRKRVRQRRSDRAPRCRRSSRWVRVEPVAAERVPGALPRSVCTAVSTRHTELLKMALRVF